MIKKKVFKNFTVQKFENDAREVMKYYSKIPIHAIDINILQNISISRAREHFLLGITTFNRLTFETIEVFVFFHILYVTKS